MTGFQDVTGTAFIVAEYRARENTEANPLYVDRIVPLFLDERTVCPDPRRQSRMAWLLNRHRQVHHRRQSC